MASAPKRLHVSKALPHEYILFLKSLNVKCFLPDIFMEGKECNRLESAESWRNVARGDDRQLFPAGKNGNVRISDIIIASVL